jgi:uncharacterized protein
MVEVEGSSPFPPTSTSLGDDPFYSHSTLFRLKSLFSVGILVASKSEEDAVERSQGGVLMDETTAGNSQDIKTQIIALIVLQKVDDEINVRNSQIKRLKDLIESEDQTINHLRENLKIRKSEIEILLKDRRDSEVTAKQKTEEAQKLGGQLYDVKTNEAYSTLQNEIQKKKHETSLLEEHVLELMVAEDEFKGKITEAESELKQGEQQVVSKQAEHKSEIAEFEKAINDFQAEWDTAAKDVAPDYLHLYQRLRSAKEGKAMARIENDICTGCQIAIRAQATIELKKYRSILYCNNCARILYTD